MAKEGNRQVKGVAYRFVAAWVLSLGFCIVSSPGWSQGTGYNGYFLYSPNTTLRTTYLRDPNGTIVHSWTHTTTTGFSVALGRDGTLYRSAVSGTGMQSAGVSGLIEAIGKSGEIKWSFPYRSANGALHHYMDVMPNGHVLATAWELKSKDSATARSINANGNVWIDQILEIAPPDSANPAAHVVWEWHMWDHLVPAAQAAAYPRRFNTALRATGSTSGAALAVGDWTHFNGISYDESRDEIAFSSRNFDEFYVIDHSTTVAEAADSVGGKRGHGGDLLYRWGAAANYGVDGSQYFTVTHAVKFIPPGYPGAGNFVVVHNREAIAPNQTHCIEVQPPRDSLGAYVHVPGLAFGPAGALDTFTTSGYYNTTTGSAQRLPNGNTMCVESDNGMIREWDSTGALVWQYQAVANTPVAYKYAPDDPGILALLGTTPIANPLLHRGMRPDVGRSGRVLAFRGLVGARLEMFSLDGRRVYSGMIATDPYRIPDIAPHETRWVRIRRGDHTETVAVGPAP